MRGERGRVKEEKTAATQATTLPIFILSLHKLTILAKKKQ